MWNSVLKQRVKWKKDGRVLGAIVSFIAGFLRWLLLLVCELA